ncbi:MAG: ABC transporter permease, partial [Clostridiales bacterium]|nr:ABC transporter permease [Clostridiales bacterium]
IYAIGDSEACAVNSGIPVKKTRFWVYTLSGFCSGLAAVLLLARTNSAGATLGDGYEFNAIAAVVIGGTAMEGGKGGFKGTIFGAIFISAMKNGLQLIGLSNYWQQVCLGIVIIAIILYDVIHARLISRKQTRRVYSEG